ncbi:Uncharacterised protein [Bartonella grahamii]|uniref:Phage related protein n=1 Tax=Bartonella grahamii TaxID=33045 RepID=A0A336NGZ9_BARGR|nr:Uncharacterised protein [Bartonella grahamii]
MELILGTSLTFQICVVFFLRGVDDDREIDRFRYLGTLQNDAMRKHDHSGQSFTILNDEDEEESWYGDLTIIWGYVLNDQQRLKLAERLGVRAEDIRVHHKLAFPHSHLHMRDVALARSGVSETRPINMSVVWNQDVRFVCRRFMIGL